MANVTDTRDEAARVRAAGLAGIPLLIAAASSAEALMVGSALAAVALAMALKGKSDMNMASLVPARTARSVRPDAETIKEITDVR